MISFFFCYAVEYSSSYVRGFFPQGCYTDMRFKEAAGIDVVRLVVPTGIEGRYRRGLVFLLPQHTTKAKPFEFAFVVVV
jgi:hypothetical protein